MTVAPLVAPIIRRRGGGLRRLLLLGALLGVGVVAAGALVMGLALLLPALIVLLFETSRGLPATRATVLFGLAASVPSMFSLMQAGGGLQAGVALALDPDVVVRAWIAQGTGWLLAELLPFFLNLQAERTATATLRDLRHARDALTSEWSHLAGVAASGSGPSPEPQAAASQTATAETGAMAVGPKPGTELIAAAGTTRAPVAAARH